MEEIDLKQLAQKLAEGARTWVNEEEKRIDAILAARKIAEDAKVQPRKAS
jgi:hypothetical protein